MDNLRLILIVIGLVILGLIWLLHRPEGSSRRPGASRRDERRRREPRLEPELPADDDDDRPSDAGPRQASLPDLGTEDPDPSRADAPDSFRRKADREPQVPPESDWRDSDSTAVASGSPDRSPADATSPAIVTLYIRARGDRQISGLSLLDAAIKAGLRFGEMKIFHRRHRGADRVDGRAAGVQHGEADVERRGESGPVGVLALGADAAGAAVDHEGRHAPGYRDHRRIGRAGAAPGRGAFARAGRRGGGLGRLHPMRVVAFYLVLLAGQGLLSATFGTLPAPDLFLIAMLTFLGRLVPWQLVAAAYGVGLLQDLIGFGALGLHAIGLAAAALVATVVRMQLSGMGLLERLLIIVGAQAGKWAVMALLLVWLSGTPEDPAMLLAVAVTETVLTAALGLLLLPAADALLEKSKMLRKELL